MAQNECQQMPKDEFYRDLRAKVKKVDLMMMQLREDAIWMNTLDATTATAMTIPADVQTALDRLRTAMNEFVDFYDGTATTQTRVLKTYINQIRYI